MHHNIQAVVLFVAKHDVVADKSSAAVKLLLLDSSTVS
jgi:hypothetical protein